MPAASVLITGANSGIGKEVARQFAEADSFDIIYLACRNQTKAEAAREDLERTTGKSIFTTVPLDTSDLDSVRAAIGFVDTPLQAVVMNAGGAGVFPGGTCCSAAFRRSRWRRFPLRR